MKNEKIFLNNSLRLLLLLFTACAAVSFLNVPSLWAQATMDVPLQATTDDSNTTDLVLEEEWNEYKDEVVLDPYHKYNRWMFNVNNFVYRKVFTPLSKVYDFLIPRKIQSSLNNVIQMASTPKRFFNNLFQKKPKAAFIEFERLLINASIGIGGLFDPAEAFFHLEQSNEDFGQTLAVYGMEPGPYFIWPIIGPSTRRDTVGVVMDNAFDPFFWFGIYDVEPEDGFRAFGVTKRVNNYSYTVRDGYDRLTESAIDPYIALQNAFLQNREKDINK